MTATLTGRLVTVHVGEEHIEATVRLDPVQDAERAGALASLLLGPVELVPSGTAVPAAPAKEARSTKGDGLTPSQVYPPERYPGWIKTAKYAERRGRNRVWVRRQMAKGLLVEGRDWVAVTFGRGKRFRYVFRPDGDDAQEDE